MARPKQKKKSSKTSAQASSPNKGPFAKGFWMRNKWPALILFVLPFLLYGVTIGYGYALDDKIVVSENEFVAKGFDGIGDIFGTESFTGFLGAQKNLVVGARYRPLSIATFAAERGMFGESPGLNHFFNILLYALTCLLLYRVLKIITPGKKDAPWYFSLPFIATLLFVFHPVHTEVVANIKGRDEILALLLSLLTLYCCLRYVLQKNLLYILAAPLVFIFAIFAKENSLTFLGVIPLVFLLFTRIPLKKVALVTAPLVGATVIYLAIRTSVIGYLLDSGVEITNLMNNPFVEATGGEKSATITYTLGLYIKLLFFPHPLTHDYYPYHIPLVSWGDMRAILSLTLYLGLIAVAIWQWKKSRIITFSILFYLGTLSIVSNILFPVGTFMNERFIYMPSVGFCLVLAYLILHKLPGLIGEKSGKMVVYGLVSAFVLGFGIKTVTRVPVWENNWELDKAAVKVSQNSARANQYHAYSLYEQALQEQDRAKQKELYDEAYPYVSKALEIHPTYTDALTCKGGIVAGYYQLDGDINKFLDEFYKIVTAAPYPLTFTEQYLQYLNRRRKHIPELLDFYHRVGWEHFWVVKKDANTARKYLNYGAQLHPGDARIQRDLQLIQ